MSRVSHTVTYACVEYKVCREPQLLLLLVDARSGDAAGCGVLLLLPLLLLCACVLAEAAASSSGSILLLQHKHGRDGRGLSR